MFQKVQLKIKLKTSKHLDYRWQSNSKWTNYISFGCLPLPLICNFTSMRKSVKSENRENLLDCTPRLIPLKISNRECFRDQVEI